MVIAVNIFEEKNHPVSEVHSGSFAAGSPTVMSGFWFFASKRQNAIYISPSSGEGHPAPGTASRANGTLSLAD